MHCWPSRRFAISKLTCVALACLGLAARAHAQEATQRVEVVGATPLPGLDVPKDQVPGNVQTARAADIERSRAADLTQFLNRRLGSVHLNDVQNNPVQPDVNYRGFTASPLLGTAQGLSVYLDGVRLNQPFGDVVSWDLIPKSAISTIALMPGSNPLFGLNTLGGALSIQTKDGLKNPGASVQLLAGSHGRAALEFEVGGGQAEGLHWFVTGNRFQEKGWRVDSPSEVNQLFGKLGGRVGTARFSLTVAGAQTDLNGNGLQEQRLLEANRSSVYSKPDTTKNRSLLLNMNVLQALNDHLSLSAQLYARRLRTNTFNGDVNDDSLDQSVYQPNSSEQAALAAAGYTGVPLSGENAANTPFPKWRCIANALLNDEPGEKCNGVINQSRTAQSNVGAGLQLNGTAQWAGGRHQWVAGLALDTSRVQFNQGSELAYLNPDHSLTGVGAFVDGVNGGVVDGVPYDTRVNLAARSQTASLFASDVWALNPRTHLTGSARYNRSTVKSQDAINPGGGPGSLDGDHTFKRLNPALGLTFAATPTLTAYAGFNQGSRSPSAIELGCADPANPCKLPNAMAGDPPLKQVVTSTMEAGLRGGQGSMRWNVGVFRADNRDDILFVADNAAGFGYFKNFGKTRRQGVEAGLSMKVGGATFSAHYTWLDATFRSPEALGGAGNSRNESAEEGFPGVDGEIDIHTGDRIPLVPRQMLKLAVELPLPRGFSVGADATAISGAYARGNENNAHQPDGTYYLGQGRSAGYAVLNLTSEWRAQPSTTLFAQVNNALNTRYNSAAQLGATGFNSAGQFQAQPFPANVNGDRPLVGSTFYAPGAPRAVFIGLRYTLNP
jgi:outer membrane receptor protein involved in Fe transport